MAFLCVEHTSGSRGPVGDVSLTSLQTALRELGEGGGGGVVEGGGGHGRRAITWELEEQLAAVLT